MSQAAAVQSQLTIDNEHLVQLGLADALLEAVRGGRLQEEISGLLEQFIEYSELHFSSEQQLMRLHAYPDYAEHAADHDAMLERMRAVRGDRAAALVASAERLRGELIGHIRNRDAALHAHLARLAGNVN
ncbi:MAG TPA: hemerythrin family protein [Gammaproteobacteria bacterium]